MTPTPPVSRTRTASEEGLFTLRYALLPSSPLLPRQRQNSSCWTRPIPKEAPGNLTPPPKPDERESFGLGFFGQQRSRRLSTPHTSVIFLLIFDIGS
ncbi:hypothetical protein BDZ45DRAFT_736386 [Acephala macrosclerotiorum]|nr:hypothetical protein BDZ45DRAFT_736386 [Acephala macrosclerotiorum]